MVGGNNIHLGGGIVVNTPTFGAGPGSTFNLPITLTTAQVQAKLFRPIQRHHHRHSEHTTCLPGKAGTAPDFSPGVTRDQVLKRFVEFSPILQRCIYMRIPQHGTPHLHSLLVALALIHRPASSGVQKRGNFIVESVLLFDIGEVRSVELNISRTWNLICEKASVRGRRGRIVRTGDHQRWYANPA